MTSPRPPPRPRRAAFTVVEILVVLTVVGLVMGAAWTLFGHGVSTSQRITGTLDAQRVLRARFQSIVHELQGARKIFFPSPGGKSQGGVGYVDRGGRAHMIFTDREGDELVLVHADLNAKTREVLARDVAAFRVTVPPPAPGEVSRTVNLTFGLKVDGSEDAEGTRSDLRMVTSVTLRALEERYPD